MTSHLGTDCINEAHKVRGERRRLSEVKRCKDLRLVDESDTARPTRCVDTKHNHLRSTGNSGRCMGNDDLGLLPLGRLHRDTDSYQAQHSTAIFSPSRGVAAFAQEGYNAQHIVVPIMSTPQYGQCNTRGVLCRDCWC